MFYLRIYLFSGKQEYHCHQGRDKHKKAKNNYLQKQTKRILHEHSHIKTRKSTQPTKKMNCPVKFTVKKIITFPSYSIEKDTKRRRTESSYSLRKHLVNIKSLNNLTASKHEKLVGDVTFDEEKFKPPILQYIVRLPKNERHVFHHTGRAAGLSEKLDERISKHLRKLIENGNRSVKDLQSRAKEFAREKILFDENAPMDITRKRF